MGEIEAERGKESRVSVYLVSDISLVFLSLPPAQEEWRGGTAFEVIMGSAGGHLCFSVKSRNWHSCALKASCKHSH